MKQNIKDVAIALAVLAGTAVVLYGLWRAKEGITAAAGAIGETVGTHLNPASEQNIVYTGVNAVGGAIAGSDDWSLGSALYDWLHP